MREPFFRIGVLSVLFYLMCSMVVVGNVANVESSITTHETYTDASIIWSDNFDDGNYDNWIIEGINMSSNPPSFCDGNFSVADGTLRATGEPEWNYASHESTVAYGTWSFDVDVVDGTHNHFYINFIAEEWPLDATPFDAYMIQVITSEVQDGTQPGITLGKYDGGSYVHLGSPPYSPDGGFTGIHHIDVTRDTTGQFYVYLDGVLRLVAIDTSHTTSSYFRIGTGSGPAIDNLTVSNSVDVDLAPPKWDSVPEDQEIEVGEVFSYDANATDYSGIDSWWLNDSTSFAIDADGIITNTSNLVVGLYGMSISVNDTLGNVLTGTFTITVTESDQQQPQEFDIALIALAGGIVLVVVVALVMVAKKRG